MQRRFTLLSAAMLTLALAACSTAPTRFYMLAARGDPEDMNEVANPDQAETEQDDHYRHQGRMQYVTVAEIAPGASFERCGEGRHVGTGQGARWG